MKGPSHLPISVDPRASETIESQLFERIRALVGALSIERRRRLIEWATGVVAVEFSATALNLISSLRERHRYEAEQAHELDMGTSNYRVMDGGPAWACFSRWSRCSTRAPEAFVE